MQKPRYLGDQSLGAPLNAVVDTRAALPGEVATPASHRDTDQPGRSLGARRRGRDHMDRIHSATTDGAAAVRAEREGTLFYRRGGCRLRHAAGGRQSRSATSRPFSRIRLRRRGTGSRAVGMTAYVVLALDGKSFVPGVPLRSNRAGKRLRISAAVDAIELHRGAGEVLVRWGRTARANPRYPHVDDTGAPTHGTYAASMVLTSQKQPNDVRQSIGVISAGDDVRNPRSQRGENMIIFAKLYGIPREKRSRAGIGQ